MIRRNDPKASRSVRRLAVSAAVALLFTPAPRARAVDAIWVSTTDGTWSAPANWSTAVPASAGDTATFNGALPPRAVVTLDEDVTLSALTVDQRGDYTFAGSHPLTVARIEPLFYGGVTFSLPLTLSPGARVGSSASRYAPTFRFDGPVSASGALAFAGSGNRYLNGDNRALAAEVDVERGYLAASALPAVRAVTLRGGATLAFGDSLGQDPHRDRLNDAATLTLAGGTLSFSSVAWHGLTETIGPTTLARGHNRIAVGWEIGSQPVLTIASLARERGATLQLGPTGYLGREGDIGQRIFLQSVPALTSGILGGWAVGVGAWPSTKPRDYDFLTYTAADGLRPLGPAARPAAVATAGAADNVLLTVPPTAPLAADATLNSLVLRNTTTDTWTLDLGGHTLNVVSGGVLSHGPTRLTHGALTAGRADDDDDAEFFARDAIEADIVDNPAGGRVSLVVPGPAVDPSSTTPGNAPVLSGRNTYSGRTIINGGTLHVASATALPAGTPIDMSGGELDIDTPAVYATGPLTLRDTARISAQPLGGSGVSLNASSYALESGELDFLSLAGTGPITKTTPNRVYILGPNPAYAGSVDIVEGDLAFGHTFNTPASPRALGTAPVTVRAGGRLVLLGGWIDNPVTLAGGTLTATGSGAGSIVVGPFGDFAGPVNITADSVVYTSEGAHVRLTGPLTIPAHRSLTKTGVAALIVAGPITAGPGATLLVHERQVVLASGGHPDLILRGETNAAISFTAAAQLAALKLSGNASTTLAAGRRALTLHALTLADTSSLNLTDGALILDYATGSPSPTTEIRDLILANRLTSSLKSPTRTLGYAEAADVLTFSAGAATFQRQTVDPTTLLVRLTLPGDANLDGAVNFDDLLALAKHYNATGPASTWSAGDFTYDNTINFEDLLVLAKNYNASLSPTPSPTADFNTDLAAAFAAAVPEPSTPALLLAACGFALTPRRNRHPRPTPA